MPPSNPRTKPDPSGADTATLALRIDGTSLRLDPRKIAWRDEADLFKAVGLTLAQLIDAVSTGAVAPFMLAGFAFLARRQAGEAVSFEAVADGITYESNVEIDDASDQDVDGAPPEGRAAD